MGLNPPPSPEEILNSRFASYWLKDALGRALDRDPIDALRDAALLQAVLARRADQLLQSHQLQTQT